MGSDLNRRPESEFVARTATGEWDGVVVTQAAFGLLGVSADVMQRYLDEQVGAFEAEVRELKGDRASVKKIEAAKVRVVQRIKGKIDQARKDDGVSFDRSGCDYLFIDEAHHYKNLYVPSSIRESRFRARPRPRI